VACPDPNLIAELAAGTVGAGERSSVEAHLQSCADCRRLVHDLRLAPEPEPGSTIGRYRVVKKLGAGAMGAVWAAYDPKLDRQVALKLLHATGDQQRMVAEGRAMARLAHPNVVPVLDLDTTDDGRVFAAMELVDGVTFRQWLAAAPRTTSAIVAVLLDAGRGLAAAHAAGLTHRDFKPENLLIGADGRTRVTDFGLARSSSLGGAMSLPTELATATTSPRSVSGALVGTPVYMAPEQFRAEAATAASDQFSFCVVLWEALYGSRPFDDGATSVTGLAEAVLAGRPREPAKNRRVPSRLRRILLRGLAGDPADRHPSLDELLAALESVLDNRRRIGVAVGLALVALLAGGAVWWRAHEARLCREPALGAIWTPARRAALASGFAKSGASFAASTWPHLERALDEWARGFAEMSRDSCEATEIRRTQSRELWLLRHQCLEERKASFTALLDAFDQPTPVVVERASQAVGALPGVAECGDMKRLVGPLPPRPEVAAEAEALHARYAAAKVHATIGAGAAVVKELEPVVERAHAIGDRVLEGELLVLRSKLENKAGAVDASLASARAAVIAAEEGRDDLTRTLAWLRQVEIQAERAPAEAARALENAHAVLSRVDDLELSAQYEAHAATLDYYAGRAAVAYEHDLRATAFMEKKYGSDDAHVAGYISQEATALIVRGEYDAADRQLLRAQSIIEKTRGKDHPSYAIAESTQAFCAVARGRSDLAVSLAEDALARLERSRGPSHLELLDPLDSLSRALHEVGRLREAQKVAARELEIGLLTGPDSPEACLARMTSGDILRDARSLDESQRNYQRLLAAGQGEGHAYASEARMGLSAIAVERGQIARARALCEEMRSGLDASEEAGLMNNQICFAKVEEAEGHHAAALARVQAVIADGEKRHRSAMPWGYGAELVWAGRLLLHMGRNSEARPLLERALGAEPSPAPGVVDSMVEGRILLGQLLQSEDRVRAAALAREALELLDKMESPDPARAPEARRLLTAAK
jgi:tetratricopeptide (TPR) repeat protein